MKSENIDNQVSKEKQKDVRLCDDSLINVKISDVLTPVTCAFLINEILQGLLYQKCQIPYPYNWLKVQVDKKRRNLKSENHDIKINFNLTNHFRVVSAAYDTIKNIMNGIITEFSEKGHFVKEVIFIFGTIPQTPKEIYTIKMSSLAKGHSENNHANSICKHRQNILRSIFLSQQWLDAVDNSMSCTNTYVFLKTIETNKNISVESNNFFIPSRPLTLSPRAKHIRINLNYEFSKQSNCCENVYVFEDGSDIDAVQQRQPTISEEEIEEAVVWYQSRDLFKGFKDCYIDKVSVSELW